jgi:hypothetical protein
VVIESSIPSVYTGVWMNYYNISPEQFLIIDLMPGETADFTRTYVFSMEGFVREDCNGDAQINQQDLALMALAWLSEPNHPYWDTACDISHPPDDIIDNRDLAALGALWRQDIIYGEPIAHWRFDESEGDITTDSRRGYTGTLVNFATDDSQWINGRMGSALAFDGIDDYIQIEGCTGIDAKQARTVTAFFKTDGALENNYPIISWGNPSPGQYWLLEIDTNQVLRLSCNNGFVSTASTRTLSSQSWHHVAAVLNPIDPNHPRISDITLYVDSTILPYYDLMEYDIITGSMDNLRIGASHDPNSSTFKGIIDEVKIFDVALGTLGVRNTITSQD